jgi:hypothetical protein
MQHLNSKSLFEWYTRNSLSESIVCLSYSSNIWPVPYVSYDDARLWNLSIFWIIFEFVSKTIDNTLPHTPNAIAVRICIHHCMEMNVDDRNIVVADAPAPDQASWIPKFSWTSFSCIDGFTTSHCLMFRKVTLCWELAACTPTAKWITPKANRIFEGSKARSISCNPPTDTDGGHAHIIGRSMCQFGLPPVPKQSTIVLDPSTGLCRKKLLDSSTIL